MATADAATARRCKAGRPMPLKTHVTAAFSTFRHTTAAANANGPAAAIYLAPYMTERSERAHKQIATTAGSPSRVSHEVTVIRIRLTRSLSFWTWAKEGKRIWLITVVMKLEGV